MAVIKGILARVYACDDSVAATSFTDEATTANGDRTEFTITASAKRFWDPETAVVVKYNGSPVTDYSVLQRPGGKVTWESSPGASAVTVTGAYFDVAAFAQCNSWELAAEFDYIDVTCFGDLMRVQQPSMRSATVNLGGFYLDETRLDWLTNANIIGLDLFMDATASSELRFTMFARPASVGINATVDGMVESPVTFNVIDGPYYMAGL